MHSLVSNDNVTIGVEMTQIQMASKNCKDHKTLYHENTWLVSKSIWQKLWEKVEVRALFSQPYMCRLITYLAYMQVYYKGWYNI